MQYLDAKILIITPELGYVFQVEFTYIPIDKSLRQNMGIFKKLVLNNSEFGQDDDLLQFVFGASFGLLFLCWTVLTWKLFVLG